MKHKKPSLLNISIHNGEKRTCRFIMKILCLNIILLTFSCNKDESFTDNNPSFSTKVHGPIVLGNRLNDPYMFSNMQNAYNALLSQGLVPPVPRISPTDIYVRVLCTSDSVMDMVESNDAITWFEYPLNYEIVQSGDYFFDNLLSDSTWTYLYGVIPVGYNLPAGIQYDTIYPVFIPDNDVTYLGNEDFYDELERTSIALCGFDKTERVEQDRGRWRPLAIVTVWDSMSNSYIPLKGVKISANTFTRTSHWYTDQNGICNFDVHYSLKAQYCLHWKRDYWKIIEPGKKKTAVIVGPYKKGDWMCQIGNTDKINLGRAMIHRVAYFANYSPDWTIQRPHKNILGFIPKKLKIKYNDGNSIENGLIGRSGCVSSSGTDGADIVIWGKNSDGTRYSSLDILSTCIHEFAHFSHYFFFGTSKFDLVNSFIAESWASCVQWSITTNLYPGHFGNLGYADGLQEWNVSSMANSPKYAYTPIFIDLMDSYNQGLNNGSYCFDNISNYSLLEIQNTYLKNVKNREELNLKLRDSTKWQHNETHNDVESLIDFYEQF